MLTRPRRRGGPSDNSCLEFGWRKIEPARSASGTPGRSAVLTNGRSRPACKSFNGFNYPEPAGRLIMAGKVPNAPSWEAVENASALWRILDGHPSAHYLHMRHVRIVNCESKYWIWWADAG